MLTNVKYMPIIDASIGYQNLQLNENSLSLTMLACQFGRYRLISLPFGVVPAGHILQ